MSIYVKSLLFLLGIAVIGLGIFIVLNSELHFPKFSKASAPPGPISCDFTGVSYQEGQARMAGDGCNTCVCSEMGWSCTENACFDDGARDVGTVSGTLGKVDGAYVTDRVCAVDLNTEKRRCVEVLANTPSYAIRLPEGMYWVYAEDNDREDGYKAYYSEYILCTEGECKDHSPVGVEVKGGEIAEAHPQDWDAPSWIDKVTITPSQRKYESNYYNPGARFNVRARNMSEIEFFYLFVKLTPQDNDTNPKSVGKATLVGTDERGWQTWVLPVSEGFSSSHVWPVGRDDGGHVMRGWNLGRTKQDESIEEKLD